MKRTMNKNVKKTIKALSTIMALCASFSTLAADVAVLNHNFESDVIPLNTNQTSSVSGWVKNGQGEVGTYLPETGVDYPDSTARGQSAFLEEAGKFYQAPNAKILAGETYTLTFDVGRPTHQDRLSMVARVKASGVALAQLQLNNTHVEAGMWTTQSLTFTADQTMPIGSKVVIEFHNLSFAADSQVDIDNVDLTVSNPMALILPEQSNETSDQVIVIRESTTLNVPSDYASINHALDFLDDKFISGNAIVTIQVDDCSNQVFDNPITLRHPHGKQLEIIGNLASPSSCVLRFNGSSGFIIENNRNIRRINGFHIQGNRVNTTNGIHATKGANLTLGASTLISGFYNGIKASLGGRVYANTVLVSLNAGTGMISEQDGYIQANNAQSNENDLHGFNAINAGKIEANNAKAVANNGHGFYALNFSIIESIEAQTGSNGGVAYYASNKSIVDAKSSSSNNDLVGYQCDYNGYINQEGSTYAGNSVSHSPEIGAFSVNCLMD